MQGQGGNVAILKVNLPREEVGGGLAGGVGGVGVGDILEAANGADDAADDDKLGLGRLLKQREGRLEQSHGPHRVDVEVLLDVGERHLGDGLVGVGGKGAGVGDDDVDGADALVVLGLLDGLEGVRV